MLPYLLRRPAAIGTPLHLSRKGGFTAPPVPGVRTFTGSPRAAADQARGVGLH
ncbi:hypothetical protein AB0M44_28540 [Streptosporangium subroseum]|uniref:hypothetical protein n=1 Tax=Streptosporangium subroseum TaxID=106412 RepID=UPI0034223371